MQSDREKMEQIRVDLTLSGAKPLAVIPTSVFREIIADLPFYTFKDIDQEGKVKVNVANTKTPEHVVNIVAGMSLAIFIASAIIGFAFFSMLLILSAAQLSALLLILVGLNVAEDSLDDSVIGSILVDIMLPTLMFLKLHDKLKNKKTLLWPNKQDEGSDRVTLILPTAPISVKKKLAACYKNSINTYLVIHKKGFGIDSKEVKSIFVEKYDPIICTDRGKFTAIIDQFGDIPEEKELVENIRAKFKNLENELSLKAIDLLN